MYITYIYVDEDQFQKFVDYFKTRRHKIISSRIVQVFYAQSCVRLHTTGAIYETPEVKSSIQIKEILEMFTPSISDDQIQCPVIECCPGIGKTTFANEICLQWANNQFHTLDNLLVLLRNYIQMRTATEQLGEIMLTTYQVYIEISLIRYGHE